MSDVRRSAVPGTAWPPPVAPLRPVAAPAVPAPPGTDAPDGGIATRLGGMTRRLFTPGPLVDGAVVAALFIADITAQILATAEYDVTSARLGVAALVLAMLSAAVLWWRRPRPLTVLAGTLVLFAVSAAAIDPGLVTHRSGATLVLVIYAVASWSERRVWATAVPAALIVLAIAGALGDGTGVGESFAVGLAVGALPWALGYAARTRRLYLVEVEGRLADVQRERDTKARRAVLDERAHIARELHDVVAHHVSLIGVQAGAARTALDRSPAATQAALQAIEATSRAAVGEMRHVLDALRDDEGAASVVPQPCLQDLDRLIEEFRRAGIDVDYRNNRPGTVLPPLLELCCYRIVEEALTNITSHSAASRATVVIDHRPDRVRLEIADPGPSRHVGRSGGRGLVGMTERVALFAGTLSVGPRSDGGFAVVADLPHGETRSVSRDPDAAAG